jgi:hypothetical protein
VYHKPSPISTAPAKSKPIAVNFNGGKLTSDTGVILLPLADQKIKLVERINQIILDPRDQRYIHHQQTDLLSFVFIELCVCIDGVDSPHGIAGDSAVEGSVQYDSVEVVQDRGGGFGVGSSDCIFIAELLSGAGVVAVGV